MINFCMSLSINSHLLISDVDMLLSQFMVRDFNLDVVLGSSHLNEKDQRASFNCLLPEQNLLHDSRISELYELHLRFAFGCSKLKL